MSARSTLLILNLLIGGLSIAQTPDVDPRFHTFDEVLEEIESLVVFYPNLCYEDTVGTTDIDSLPVVVVKISTNAVHCVDKSNILVVVGQHFRNTTES